MMTLITRCPIKSAKSMTAVPISADPGKDTRQSTPNIRRAKCGATKPTNPTMPTAPTAAAVMAVPTMRISFVSRFTSTPSLSALASPTAKAFSRRLREYKNANPITKVGKSKPTLVQVESDV